MAKMTRKHFELIAEAIRGMPNLGATSADQHFKRQVLMAHHFADRLRATNADFDRARFIAAATRED
jgi:hypothetical protein